MPLEWLFAVPLVLFLLQGFVSLHSCLVGPDETAAYAALHYKNANPAASSLQWSLPLFFLRNDNNFFCVFGLRFVEKRRASYVFTQTYRHSYQTKRWTLCGSYCVFQISYSLLGDLWLSTTVEMPVLDNKLCIPHFTLVFPGCLFTIIYTFIHMLLGENASLCTLRFFFHLFFSCL